jgi:hypothetical protein
MRGVNKLPVAKCAVFALREVGGGFPARCGTCSAANYQTRVKQQHDCTAAPDDAQGSRSPAAISRLDRRAGL